MLCQHCKMSEAVFIRFMRTITRGTERLALCGDCAATALARACDVIPNLSAELFRYYREREEAVKAIKPVMTPEKSLAYWNVVLEIVSSVTDQNTRAVAVQSAIAEGGPVPEVLRDQVEALLRKP